MENLLFAVNGVAPVFIIILLGFLLKNRGILSEHFSQQSSKLIFNVALPALIFIKIAQTEFKMAYYQKQILFVLTATFVLFILVWFGTKILMSDARNRAVFIQGSFRSNIAIIGFALIYTMFGSDALGNAALLLAFVIPLYVILSVIALMLPQWNHQKLALKHILQDIVTNPLIVAGVFAMPFSYFSLELNHVLVNTITYLSGLALPLALLSIGSSFTFSYFKHSLQTSLYCALIKIVLAPLIIMSIAYAMGFTGTDFGVLFILFACPTAAASYIMASAMGANKELAGNIVLTSTLGSVFTISIGMFIIKSLGLV